MGFQLNAAFNHTRLIADSYYAFRIRPMPV
jgi:hypothetical protein